jgi:hypothetical protein
MSEIDCYRHRCIGIVHCPSAYWPRNFHQLVALYLLEEDAADSGFTGKKGDLILGGGGGEAAALRISMPEAIIFFTREDSDEQINNEEFETLGDLHDYIYMAYWDMTSAFVFGDGYARLGWNPHKQSIELWLVHHILEFVRRNYSERWGHLFGSEELEGDGSICRLPTGEEASL